MIDDASALADLFTWSARDRQFRIRFADGEYIMKAVLAGQDQGQPVHAVGSIVERISGPEQITSAVALFFLLEDLLEVTDASNGETIFRAA